tara:strand:+ start:1036 stop:2094 length:1059 start_codon:yes stop_codon:yes gene_type:complete
MINRENLLFKKLKKKNFLVKQKDLHNITKSNKKDLIIKKCLNLSSSCSYSAPAFEYRKIFNPLETNNIFKFINNYFYGYCHEITFFLKYLLKIHNIKSKIIRAKSKKFPISHWFLEIKLKNKWILVDPTLGLYFKSKATNKYLSLLELKNHKNISIISNKKISFSKFKNNKKDNYFFFKRKKSFDKVRKKYFDLFSITEHVKIDDGKYSYKKKILSNHNIKDFMIFKSFEFGFKDFELSKTKFSKGFKMGKLVESDKFIKFKSFLFKKRLFQKKFVIKNFPYPIIDLELKSDNSNNRVRVMINKKKKIIVNTNTWIFKNFYKSKYFYAEPIRNICILNSSQLKSITILFSRT